MTSRRTSPAAYDEFWALFGPEALDQWRTARGAAMILTPDQVPGPGRPTQGMECKIVDLRESVLDYTARS